MRLKDITTLNPQCKIDTLSTDVSFVPMESIRTGCLTPQYIDFNLGKNKYNYFAEGDLLIAKVTPCFENGNIAIAEILKEHVGFGSSELFVLRCGEKINNRFLFYLCLTVGFKNAACATMTGVAGLKRISPLFMRTYEVDLPSIADQSRIAKYLDTKTSTIDSRISVLEQKRDAYGRLEKGIINDAVTHGLNPKVKMKDSGVDWIGEIPEHWERRRLKDFAILYGGLTGKSGDDFRCDDEEATKPFIPFTNILNNIRIDFCNFKRVVMSDDEIQNQVKENDLLFLMSSEDYESIAKSSVVVGNPGEVYLNSFCRGLRIKDKEVLPEFVNYQLQASKYRDALRFEARGFTRINIMGGKVASMFVSLPPYQEQQEIVVYLDDKLSKVDYAITLLNAQIEKFKLLKRSLINEVITGHRAV